ncbi:alkylphosphonate utilization protein [Hymenobacter sp. PAMC 26628]|uniref:alkylphosphonate utilization protein n=1 Tax=Hymenobacter sp. PAMC 26628 TaxID=1484118 RepID=UPI00076FE0F9|nr:alkylphosphonate utilization protein [Hymenobacter sp. PAMC 26628]AMJ64951.1 PhnA protein [Hymenobacter sp. PAMC 26628]
MDSKDSNGALLAEGDSVTLIKDLKVKDSSLTLKRGTLVKNIRLTGSLSEVEGRAGGSTMVLKTEFLKKA